MGRLIGPIVHAPFVLSNVYIFPYQLWTSTENFLHCSCAWKVHSPTARSCEIEGLRTTV